MTKSNGPRAARTAPRGVTSPAPRAIDPAIAELVAAFNARSTSPTNADAWAGNVDGLRKRVAALMPSTGGRKSAFCDACRAINVNPKLVRARLRSAGIAKPYDTRDEIMDIVRACAPPAPVTPIVAAPVTTKRKRA